MIQLVKNETAKIFSRKLAKVLFALLVVFSIATAVTSKLQDNQITDWRTKESRIISENENRIRLSNLDPQLKTEAQNKVKIARYRLKNNISPAKSNPWSATLKASGLIEMVIITVIIMAAEMISREFTDGTIKLLLIRPHRRTKVLFSKYMALIIFSTLSLFVVLSSQLIFNSFLYGLPSLTSEFTSTDLFINTNGKIESLLNASQLLKLYGLSFFSIMSYGTIAFTISTVLRNSTLAVGSSLFLMMVGNSMIEATSKIAWLKYLPFANSDFSLYIYHLAPRSEMTVLFSITVLLVYILLLNGISFYVFNKRDII